MSRWKPTPIQLDALRSVAARRVIRASVGPYKDSSTGETIPLTTMRRLILEDVVRAPTRYGDLFEVTDDGRALLVALDGAS